VASWVTGWLADWLAGCADDADKTLVGMAGMFIKSLKKYKEIDLEIHRGLIVYIPS